MCWVLLEETGDVEGTEGAHHAVSNERLGDAIQKRDVTTVLLF